MLQLPRRAYCSRKELGPHRRHAAPIFGMTQIISTLRIKSPTFFASKLRHLVLVRAFFHPIETAMAGMDRSQRFELIVRNLDEVLNPELIENILAEGRDPKVYWGEL